MVLLHKDCSINKKILVSFFVLSFVFGFVTLIKAQTTTSSNNKNDFVLEPGRVEIFANPGESIDKSITITNRASSKVSFKIEIEDFVGSNDKDKPVVLLGNERSPYSFKDNIVPEINDFTLESNESITVPIKVNVPINAQPGGFYTSILVSNKPSVDLADKTSGVEGKTKIISRIGTLFFIRVNGVAEENGLLDDLQVIKPTNKDSDTYKFNILFKNNGNIYLVPFGWITVTNIFGKTIGKIPVDAYFSMPKSLRYREIEWQASSLIGRFKASIELNRGYGSDLVDTKTVVFWVIPWKLMITILSIILVIVLGLYYFFKKFKFVAR